MASDGTSSSSSDDDPLVSTLQRDAVPPEVRRFHQWVDRHKDYSDNTARNYYRGVRRWAWWVHEHDVDLIEPAEGDVEDFFGDLREEVSEKTVNTTRSALSVFLRKRGPWEDPKPNGSSSYSDKTPLDEADLGSWGAESEKSKQTLEQVHYLTEDQAKKLLDNVPEPELRNRLVAKLMLQTGVRASELLDIKCGVDPDWQQNDLRDIDREERAIRVRDSKSGGNRLVVYQQSLEDLLRIWIETEREGHLGASESPYLFPTGRSQRLSEYQLNQIVKQSAEEAGIQSTYTTHGGEDRATVTSHVLRHTFAMHALRNDMDTKWIKEALGHDDISTTIQMYLHADQEQLKDELRKRGPSFD